MSSARIECGFCFTVPVTGFCENCQYRLCETCSKNHPRVDMFKNHSVVCNEGFTNPKEELDVDIHERNCTIHTDEKTTLYCEEHDVCLCVCCLLLEHKGCICSTIYLRNVVCDTKLPNEYISKLNEIEDKTDSIASEIEENITLIAELRSKCEKDINSFYDELIIKLVKLKKNTETEIADKYRQNTEHLENVLVSCNENRERIRQHIKHITDLVQKKHDRNLYVSLKREGITTDEFLCSNQQCRINNQVTKLTFVPNSELDKILKNDTLTFGITIDVCDGSEEVNEQNTQVLVKTPTNSDTQINVADECDDWSTTANVDKWSTAEDSAEEETDISTGKSMTQSQREYEHRQVSTAKARKRQKRLKKLARNFKVGNLPVEIKISVQTSMKTITLSVYGSTCIEAVKAHIENKVGLPKAQQRLRFAGNYLQDDLCISDYNIQNNSTLYLA